MPDIADRARAVAALRFRALGDETRLRVLETLTTGERCVGDIMDALGLGQSLVSHHLRALREAGLVVVRRDGRRMHYAISEPALAAVRLVVYELEPIHAAGERTVPS